MRTLQLRGFSLGSKHLLCNVISFCVCVRCFSTLRFQLAPSGSRQTTKKSLHMAMLALKILFCCFFSFHALSLLSLIYPTWCVGVRLCKICFFIPWQEFCIVLASRKEKVFGMNLERSSKNLSTYKADAVEGNKKQRCSVCSEIL